ncbi:Alkane hydroxylase MAH1 [Sesamum angolense]|uniref:Alkane hydroxylase MAH1 n=1 Tax=Sesamum angolense TaxID=2727404 RepID=A0AAE1WHZ4_9LAMI|nr:Alkane hydroxylase MAH1 [Sesamum angolense]
MAYLEIFLIQIILLILFLVLLAPKNRQLLPWNWPFVRVMPTMYLKSHEIYDKITEILAENKSTVLFKTSWFTKTDILVTSDPANAHHVMSSNFSIYQRGSEFRNVFDFLGQAVFSKDLEEWREEKKFTHAFFRENQYHESVPKIVHQTLEKALIPVLDHTSQQNQELDLQSLFNRFMLDATCLLAAGFDAGSLRVGFPECPLLDAMDDIAEAVFYRHILPERVWKLQRWLRVGKEKKMAEASNTFNRILSDNVSKKKHELATDDQETGDGTFDVLKFYLKEAAINTGNKGAQKHDDKGFLAANLMTLLFAGRDTSAALLTCALCESLRLFPPGPFLLRVPNEQDVLPSGHKVDQTTKVMLCSYAMGRTREIWGDDCGEFRPERWIMEKGGTKHVASNIFLAFSSGPWTCPGRELAFTRMKAVAATVVHNYRVHVVEGQTVCPSISAILTMKHGLKATVSTDGCRSSIYLLYSIFSP